MRGIICRLFIVISLYSTQTHAQRHTPGDTISRSYTAELIKTYPLQNDLFIEGLKEETNDRKALKHYEATYKVLFKTLNEDIVDGKMVDIPEISSATTAILQELKAKNPAIPRKLQVVLVRDNYPNAHTIGDNIIFVNTGLLYCLESEDQVAGILAHEIGHQVLKHSIKALAFYFEKDKHDVENVRAVRQKDVKKTDYAIQLLKSSIYKEGEVARQHEMEADSFGYILIRNTAYKKTAFIEALEVIDRFDSLAKDTLAIETYKRVFGIPGQPFNDKWLHTEDFSAYNYGSYIPKFNRDSLSTHPKSAERIQHLKNTFPELADNSQTNKLQTRIFSNAKRIAELELIPNLYHNEQYGKALYTTLIHLQNSPGDTFYKQWLSVNLQKIYVARRDYQLNKHLDRVAPDDHDESYIRFLNLMWNMSLNELQKIATYYQSHD
ncbi:MAG: M48 family metalloprotease [Chitinophagales bacterium]|nr:M48 family metalloprotease [Chitinophagales bacterium]